MSLIYYLFTTVTLVLLSLESFSSVHDKVFFQLVQRLTDDVAVPTAQRGVNRDRADRESRKDREIYGYAQHVD